MSDRHEKWTPVEPGHVIPAGQPYRMEWPDGDGTLADQIIASERVCNDHDLPVVKFADGTRTLVDSSWKPPLVLPTEPTLGLVIAQNCKPQLGRWKRDGGKFRAHDPWPLPMVSPFAVSEVLDFIPLTDEQVKRIEAAR